MRSRGRPEKVPAEPEGFREGDEQFLASEIPSITYEVVTNLYRNLTKSRATSLRPGPSAPATCCSHSTHPNRDQGCNDGRAGGGRSRLRRLTRRSPWRLQHGRVSVCWGDAVGRCGEQTEVVEVVSARDHLDIRNVASLEEGRNHGPLLGGPVLDRYFRPSRSIHVAGIVNPCSSADRAAESAGQRGGFRSGVNVVICATASV